MRNESLYERKPIKVIVALVSFIVLGFAFVFGSIGYLCDHTWVGTIMGSGIAIAIIGFYAVLGVLSRN